MSHYTPMHARDGQRSDAIAARLARLRAAARDTWVLIRLIPVIPMIARRALPRATAAPAPASGPAQETPRPVDPPREMARGAEVRAGATPRSPGAVSADDGTGASAGEPRAPAAAALPPAPEDATAPLPRPHPSQPPWPGQRLPWVTCQPPPGTPRYRGDYRPTAPMRAVGPVPVSVVRPYYPAAEARRDSVARWGA